MSLKDPISTMPLFSSKSHSAQSYTRNPDLWCKPLEGRLCSVAVWKSQGADSYGGTLISPRHVLYCAHAFPNGRPPGASSYVQRTIRFVRPDGSVVNAVQIADRGSAGHNAVHPVGDPLRADLAVGLLDRDMTQEGFEPIPIATIDPTFLSRMQQEHVPTVCVSQGTARSTNSFNPNPPELHPIKAYIRSVTPGPAVFSGTFYAPFSQYRVWDGDSGTPQMLVFRGELYLFRIFTVSNFNGPQPGTRRDTIEDLISRVEQDSGTSISAQPTFKTLNEMVFGIS